MSVDLIDLGAFALVHIMCYLPLNENGERIGIGACNMALVSRRFAGLFRQVQMAFLIKHVGVDTWSDYVQRTTQEHRVAVAQQLYILLRRNARGKRELNIGPRAILSTNKGDGVGRGQSRLFGRHGQLFVPRVWFEAGGIVDELRALNNPPVFGYVCDNWRLVLQVRLADIVPFDLACALPESVLNKTMWVFKTRHEETRAYWHDTAGFTDADYAPLDASMCFGVEARFFTMALGSALDYRGRNVLATPRSLNYPSSDFSVENPAGNGREPRDDRYWDERDFEWQQWLCDHMSTRPDTQDGFGTAYIEWSSFDVGQFHERNLLLVDFCEEIGRDFCTVVFVVSRLDDDWPTHSCMIWHSDW